MLYSMSIGVVGLIAFGLLSGTDPSPTNQSVMTDSAIGINDTMIVNLPVFGGFAPILGYSIKHPTQILAEQRPEDLNRDVSFELYQPGRLWNAAVRKYAVGKPVCVLCFWRNEGNQPYAILLKEVGSQFPYPMCVRVTENDGIPLRADPTDNDWYSPWFLRSEMFAYEPGDIILLYPGEMISRTIELDQFLDHEPYFREGFPEGKYSIQLTLGDLLSEEFVIEMVKE